MGCVYVATEAVDIEDRHVAGVADVISPTFFLTPVEHHGTLALFRLGLRGNDQKVSQAREFVIFPAL